MSDLDLNGLRKRGAALLLEEYSHCEVPAGCGGVVLRWVKADAPVDVEVRTVVGGAAHELWIDGEKPVRDRLTLAPGAHVLAIHVRGPVEEGVLIAWIQLLRRVLVDDRVVTAADGTWKGTAIAPPEDTWRTAAFDDSSWMPLVDGVLTASAGDRMATYRIEWLQRERAVPLGFERSRPGLFQRLFGAKPVADVWIRRAFHVGPGGLR